GICVVVWGRRRHRDLRDDPSRQELYATGRAAEASILSVTYLNEAFGADPVVRVLVSLTPVDGAAEITGTREMFVSALSVPWITGRLAAAYDPANPNRFTVVTESGPDLPAHLRELHERLRAEPGAVPVSHDETLGVIARMAELR